MVSIDLFQDNTVTNIAPFIASEIGGHSFANTAFIVVSVCTGLAHQFSYKLLSVAHRFHLVAGGAVLTTAGLGVSAASQSLPMYAAGNVLYSTGWASMGTALDTYLRDATPPTRLAFIRAFNVSPGIITGLAGSPLATDFTKDHWRWCYGALAAGHPVVSGCLCLLLWRNRRRDSSTAVPPAGNDSSTSSYDKKTWRGMAWYYLVDYDVTGAVLFFAGAALPLIAFSFAGSATGTWRNPTVIGMIVGGCVLLGLFGAWEHWAPYPFLSFKHFKDRKLLGGCGLVFACNGEPAPSSCNSGAMLTISRIPLLGRVLDVKPPGCPRLFDH